MERYAISIFTCVLCVLCRLSTAVPSHSATPTNRYVRPQNESVLTWYISPNSGSSDLTVCGHTRDNPCNGLNALIDGGCNTLRGDILHVEVRLLPGTYVVPFFYSPKLLAACNNFSVVADDDDSLVTILADPTHVLTPKNGTYVPDFNKVGNNNKNFCGLNDPSNLFGHAAFAFANSTNVMLRNLVFQMSNDALDVFITLTNVGNFNIENCKFLNLPTLRQALAILNPVGEIIINNCTFEKKDHKSSPGDPYESSFNDLQIQAAVYVFQTIPNPAGAGVYIISNNFTIQRSETPLPWTYQGWKSFITRTQQQSLCRTSGEATLLKIRLDGYASNLKVFVDGNRFVANGPRYTAQSIGSAVAVSLRCNTQSSLVVLSNNLFMNHVAQQGSGIQVTVTGQVSNNVIVLIGLNFTSNGLRNWTQEGGAVRIFTSDDQELLNNIFINEIICNNNEALFGAAIYLERRFEDYQSCPRCIKPSTGYQFCETFPQIYIPPSGNAETFPRRTYYVSNISVNASYGKLGAIHAKHVVLSVIGNSSFTNNFGGALYMTDSLLKFSGYITFESNRASQGAAIALHHRSKIVVNTTAEAYYDLKNGVRFIKNWAYTRGGAIYVDQESSTLAYDDVVESGLSNLRFDYDCFIHTPAVYYEHTCLAVNATPPSAYFTFEGNSACIQGQDIYAFSLLQCIQQTIQPRSMPGCGAEITFLGPYTGNGERESKRRFLTNYPDPDGMLRRAGSTMAPAVSTGPNYLMFVAASCPCSKIVGESRFLLPNCTSNTTKAFFSLSKYLNSTAAAVRTNLPQFTLSSTLGDTLPPLNAFLLPWSGTFVTDQDAHLFTNIAESDPEALYNLDIEPSELLVNPSNIVLMPAPGEEFTLEIASVDQLQGATRSPAYMQIEASIQTEFMPATLLRQSGNFQLSHDDKIYFVPGQPVVGLAIVGMPGSEGHLKIVVPSQLIDKDIELWVPFKLAPCPFGFNNPTSYSPPTGDSLSHLALAMEYVAHARTGVIPASYLAGNDPLACNCDITNAIAGCVKGNELRITGGLWGGIVPAAGLPQTLASEFVCNDTGFKVDRTTFLDNEIVCLSPDTDPFDYMELVKNSSDFLFTACLHSACGTGDVDHMLTTTGITDRLTRGKAVSTPCADHTEGLECSQCKTNFSLTPYYVNCRNCSGASPYSVVLVTAILGLFVFSIGIYATWGVSPTLVSVIFYCQAVAAIVYASPTKPRGQEFITHSLSLDLSFGMCLTEDLTALERLIWAYFPPAYFLALLLISYILSNFKLFVKVFARRNCIRMFWLIIILSYGSLANSSVRTLRCTNIHPTPVARRLIKSSLRLMDDENVICWEGNHLIAAAVAVFIIAFILVPILLMLPYLHKWPRFKPFSDVYNSIYRTDRRWMSGVDLFRRLVLAVAVATPLNPEDQHLSGMVACMLFLAFHALFMPYEKTHNNALETILLTSLCVISSLAAPSASNSYYMAIQIWFFSTLLLVSSYKTHYYYKLHKLSVQRVVYEKFGIEMESYKLGRERQTQTHIKNVSQLRDPLMEEHFDMSIRHDSSC